MPYADINGTKLWYTDTSVGETAILFVHGLMLSGKMFEEQIATLASEYRCITLDLRGQGRSEISATGYDMDSLTRDVVALIRHLDCGPCHYVGLSMGGFIGLRLAIYHADLLLSLALLDTSADPEPVASARKYRFMAWLVRLLGFAPVIASVMKIMFGKTFLADSTKQDQRISWKKRLAANDRAGLFRAATGVIDRTGVFEQLGIIQCPTAVIVGDEDVATPPDRAARMHESINGSRLVTIAGAGHSSSIEQPEAVTLALQDFYAILTPG